MDGGNIEMNLFILSLLDFSDMDSIVNFIGVVFFIKICM